jgi:nucleotide-binding universal stress UspA family protein
MAARTYTVLVDDGARTAARLDAAVRLARDTDARLVGVYVVPDNDVGPAVATMLPPEALKGLMRAAADAQVAAETGFRRACAALPSSNVAWRAPAGDPIVAALAHQRACDLVVLGQPDPDDTRARFEGELVLASLLGAGRPILVVPYTGAQATLGKRILVATDGGREAAARSATRCSCSSARTRSCCSWAGARTPSGRRRSRRPARGSPTGCAIHGIAARVERYEWKAGGGDQWLLSRASDLGSDLIVMGGYGHSRMREVVLGGMTRTILREMTVPVLMSH